MKLALTLDDEFKRVAKEEQIEMADLVVECARLIGCSPRQLYNYRSGKWPLPGDAIPALCKRFGSLTLLHALAEGCRKTPIEVPEQFELSQLTARTVRDDLRHYERFLSAFEDGDVDKGELDELLVSGDRVIQNVRQFEAIAVAAHERRSRLRVSQSKRTPSEQS